MIALRQRTAEQGLEVHRSIPVRVYEDDVHHGPRVKKAREWVARCGPRSIVELGCGAGDVSGPFSDQSCLVMGFDINEKAVEKARERFPSANYHCMDFATVEPGGCDLLVMCEVLEHLADPLAVATRWLPRARHAVISFPLNESELFRNGVDLSAGEHQWSFTAEDLKDFISAGQHELIESEEYALGSYHCVIARSRRMK